MRADLYISKLVDFAKNLEKHAADAAIESIEVAKKELEDAFDKGVNIEGKSLRALNGSRAITRREKRLTRLKGESLLNFGIPHSKERIKH